MAFCTWERNQRSYASASVAVAYPHSMGERSSFMPQRLHQRDNPSNIQCQILSRFSSVLLGPVARPAPQVGSVSLRPLNSLGRVALPLETSLWPTTSIYLSTLQLAQLEQPHQNPPLRQRTQGNAAVRYGSSRCLPKEAYSTDQLVPWRNRQFRYSRFDSEYEGAPTEGTQAPLCLIHQVVSAPAKSPLVNPSEKLFAYSATFALGGHCSRFSPASCLPSGERWLTPALSSARAWSR